MSSIIRKPKNGFTLVEVLVYIFGLVLLVGAISGFLYYVYGWYRAVTVAPRADQVAISLITKLEYDLHSGSTISTITSASSAQGSTTIVSTVNSVSTTTTYALVGNRMTWQQNGGPIEYLTPSDISVTGFYLTKLTTPESTAVRFEIDLSYDSSHATTTTAYDGLAILDQSYQ
ncbi:MAG: hypothetical protein KGI45_00470 [Patescibacteria group bacterium]|nr:hypothetical protein [Patescibacteria group bacterium]MDE1941156.1 hypothetical protein [Patescibacteria group bacterium]MDE1966538.1 hypothetical protein [Patescibacteria group bacterium]